jgi:hypothetical protein
MQELRFVAVSEDGSYAVLAVPGRSGRFILSIDERLRAVAQGQTSRLAQYEIEVESPLRPKEIQARIRAGETAEEIADAAGIPVERVRWFEGPVLAERAYIADQAQAASVRRAGDSGGPGARLGDIVPERLTASGGTPEDGQWDSRKRGDGNWQVTLTFPSGGRLHTAEWVFDPRRRHVMPDDDNAARLSLPESELPPEPVSVPGEATVTALAPRLGAAAGMGGAGGFAGGGSGVGVRSFRPERSVIPDRSLGGDRSLADRPVSPAPAHAPAAASSSSSSSPSSPAASGSASGSAAERPGMPERTGLAHSPAATPVLPRPTYHDHTDFRDAAPEPPAHREHAAGYRASASAPSSAATGRGSDRRDYDGSAAEATVPVTAPPYVFDDPAAVDDRNRAGVTPPRQVVFEEPEPAFLDEQLELAPAASARLAPPTAEVPASTSHAAAATGHVQSASVQPASVPPTSVQPASVPPTPAEREQVAQPSAAQQQTAAVSSPAPVGAPAPVPQPAAAETRQGAPGATPAPTVHPEAAAAPRPEPVAQPAQASGVQTSAAQEPAGGTESAAEASGALPGSAAAQSTPAPAPAPVEHRTVAGSATTAQQDTSPQPATDADTAHASAPGKVRPPAASPSQVGSVAAQVAAPAQPEAVTETAAAGASAATDTSAEPVSAPAAAPTVTPTAAKAPAVPAAAAAQPEPAAAKPSPEPEPATAPADKSESAEDQSSRQRPAAKKNAKGRRSSVPSWDEIMLGSSRQRD